MKRLLVLAALLAVLSTQTFAHNGTWTGDATLTGIDVADTSTWYQWEHQDADPWKGTATITVTNQGPQSWGDFHILIMFGDGVFIEDDPAPTSSLTNYTWSLTPDARQVNFEFYSNPVAQGDTVTFEIYTDNTTAMNSLFAMAFYPTPVPEPATMVILGAGGLLILLRKK